VKYLKLWTNQFLKTKIVDNSPKAMSARLPGVIHNILTKIVDNF